MKTRIDMIRERLVKLEHHDGSPEAFDAMIRAPADIRYLLAIVKVLEDAEKEMEAGLPAIVAEMVPEMTAALMARCARLEGVLQKIQAEAPTRIACEEWTGVDVSEMAARALEDTEGGQP